MTTPSWKRWDADLERVGSGSLHIDAFIQRHRVQVRRLAQSVRWVDGFEVDDAEQVVRLAIWYAVQSFDQVTGGALGGWVGFNVRRRLQTYARKQRRDAEINVYGVELDECWRDDILTPEAAVSAAHNYRDRVLRRMDDTSQAVLKAYCLDGLSSQQIYESGMIPGISYWWTVKRVQAVLRMATVLATEF